MSDLTVSGIVLDLLADGMKFSALSCRILTERRRLNEGDRRIGFARR
jgi:hypothetical protein